MFRILYFVALTGGLLWIVQTQPVWLNPTRAVEEPPGAAAGDADWRHDVESRRDEMFRRIRIVAIATIAVIVAGEIWCLRSGRLRWFSRS